MPEEPGRSTPDTPRDPASLTSPLWWHALSRDDLPLEGRLLAPAPEPRARRRLPLPGMRELLLMACLVVVVALTVAIVFGPEVLLACGALGGATVAASLVHRRRQ